MHGSAPLIYRLDLTLLAGASPPLYRLVTEHPSFARQLFADAVRAVLAPNASCSDDNDFAEDAESFQQRQRDIASLAAVVAALPIHVTIKGTILPSSLREAAAHAAASIGCGGAQQSSSGRAAPAPAGNLVGGWFVPGGGPVAPHAPDPSGVRADATGPSSEQLRRILDQSTAAVDFSNGRLVSSVCIVAGRELFVPPPSSSSSSSATGTKALIRVVDVATREPALISVAVQGHSILVTRGAVDATSIDVVSCDDADAVAWLINSELPVSSRVRVSGFAAVAEERVAQNLPSATNRSNDRRRVHGGGAADAVASRATVPVLVPFELALLSSSPISDAASAATPAAPPDPAYDDSSPQAIAAHFADGHRAWSALLIPASFRDCGGGSGSRDGDPSFAELLRCASLSQLPTTGVVAALVTALSAGLAQKHQQEPSPTSRDQHEQPRALDLAFIGPPLFNDALCAQLSSLGISVSPWAHTALRGVTSAGGAHSSSGARFGGTVRRERGGQLLSAGGTILALRDAELLKPADIEALSSAAARSTNPGIAARPQQQQLQHQTPAVWRSTAPAATATGTVDKRLLAWIRRASFVVVFEPVPAAANVAARQARTALERCLAESPRSVPAAPLFEPVTPAGGRVVADSGSGVSTPGFSATERAALAEDCSHLRRTLDVGGFPTALPPLTRGAWTLLDGFYKHARRSCGFVDAGLMAHAAYVARVVALLARPFRHHRGDVQGALATTVADAAVAVCVVDASLAARFGSSTLAENLLDRTSLATVAAVPAARPPLPDAAGFVDQLWAVVHAEQTLALSARP